jgi:hypothetical protein
VTRHAPRKAEAGWVQHTHSEYIIALARGWRQDPSRAEADLRRDGPRLAALSGGHLRYLWTALEDTQPRGDLERAWAALLTGLEGQKNGANTLAQVVVGHPEDMVTQEAAALYTWHTLHAWAVARWGREHAVQLGAEVVSRLIETHFAVALPFTLLCQVLRDSPASAATWGGQWIHDWTTRTLAHYSVPARTTGLQALLALLVAEGADLEAVDDSGRSALGRVADSLEMAPAQDHPRGGRRIAVTHFALDSLLGAGARWEEAWPDLGPKARAFLDQHPRVRAQRLAQIVAQQRAEEGEEEVDTAPWRVL